MEIDMAIHQHRFILNRALVAKNNNAFQHTGKRFYLHASDLDLVSFWVFLQSDPGACPRKLPIPPVLSPEPKRLDGRRCSLHHSRTSSVGTCRAARSAPAMSSAVCPAPLQLHPLRPIPSGTGPVHLLPCVSPALATLHPPPSLHLT